MHRGPHIVRPSRPHKLVDYVDAPSVLANISSLDPSFRLPWPSWNWPSLSHLLEMPPVFCVVVFVYRRGRHVMVVCDGAQDSAARTRCDWYRICSRDRRTTRSFGRCAIWRAQSTSSSAWPWYSSLTWSVYDWRSCLQRLIPRLLIKTDILKQSRRSQAKNVSNVM